MHQKKWQISIFTFVTLWLLIMTLSQNSWSKGCFPNVHWTFCIDTSGSMKTKGHMDLLRLITGKITTEFLDPNKNIIKPGDRISIFSFDEEVRLEATALYQTENDVITIREKLVEINKRHGSLTFISEAVIRAIGFTEKYNEFFQTNALYVFTDGKSEPYSDKWPREKIEARKKVDVENFKKISLLGRDHELNVWVGVLKWEAFEDAKSLAKRMGKGGHLVDLTDFNRLSLEKALKNFAETVRSAVNLPQVASLDLGTIPYKVKEPYEKSISLHIQTDKTENAPSITGLINFDPDNPSQIAKEHPVSIKATEEKMVLTFELAESNELEAGTYTGKLDLFPEASQFGTVEIEPSQFDVKFKKSGYLSFYLWKGFFPAVLSFLVLFYLVTKIKRKMPIRV